MTELDFLHDVAVSGQVLGVGLGTNPTQWEQALGNDYVDDVHKGRMRRDYGLVELSFLRFENSWKCIGISIQVHRLPLPNADVIPKPLSRRYGTFQDRVSFGALVQSIIRAGASSEAIEDATRSRYRRFWIPESCALIHVIDDDVSDSGVPGPGDVWSIALSRDAETWKAPLK